MIASIRKPGIFVEDDPKSTDSSLQYYCNVATGCFEYSFIHTHSQAELFSEQFYFTKWRKFWIAESVKLTDNSLLLSFKSILFRLCYARTHTRFCFWLHFRSYTHICTYERIQFFYAVVLIFKEFSFELKIFFWTSLNLGQHNIRLVSKCFPIRYILILTQKMSKYMRVHTENTITK